MKCRLSDGRDSERLPFHKTVGAYVGILTARSSRPHSLTFKNLRAERRFVTRLPWFCGFLLRQSRHKSPKCPLDSHRGNLFILGAASNVIIIQNAEKKGKETIRFAEFARVGVPLTVVNVLVYWLFLEFV